ncbi:MAG TPA: phosphatidate cytidylyltransferase [Chitinophagaceae bacterium]|jgi:phosphatidate cytidylyltransferase|nr:phosphatidate cytidylyltransferase [Chitinophagaceae bacterium]
MAFNWQTFKTRTLTAAIFVVVMLAGLLINRWTFFILFSIIHFGCWWEYLKLVEKIHKTTFHKYFKWGLMLIGYLLLIWFGLLIYHLVGESLAFLFLLFPIAGFILLMIGISKTNLLDSRSFVSAILGVLYISLSMGLMENLYYTDAFDIFRQGRGFIIVEFFGGLGVLPLVIIFTLWINDTMAYIVGSLIGKTPLSKISPKKTWEGTIGGIILSIFIIGLLFSSNVPLYLTRNFLKQYPYPINNLYWYLTAAITAIAGTFGDLLESKLKRRAGVKDSGHIMPGHGGFLDRFDSLLIATPFVWLYVYFFMQ